MPGQVEGNALPLGNRKVGHGAEVLAAERNFTVEVNNVGPSNGDDTPVLAPDPRNEGAIVEAEDEFHPHRHLAAPALDDPNQIELFRANGHEVEDRRLTLIGLIVRFENEG